MNEIIYSATQYNNDFHIYLFQNKGPRRLIKTKICHWHGGYTDEISICTCLHNILHRHVHIHNILLAKQIHLDRLHNSSTNWILCYEIGWNWMTMSNVWRLYYMEMLDLLVKLIKALHVIGHWLYEVKWCHLESSISGW